MEIPDDVKFCIFCGTALDRKSSLSTTMTNGNLNAGGLEEIRSLLKQAWMDGTITFDEKKLITKKAEELSVAPEELKKLDEDVRRELGIDKGTEIFADNLDGEKSNRLSLMILSESYKSMSRNNMKFKLKNISSETIKKVEFVLDCREIYEKEKKEEWNNVMSGMEREFHVNFKTEEYGEFIGKLNMVHYDHEDNPTALKGEVDIFVEEKQKSNGGNAPNVNVNISGEKITGSIIELKGLVNEATSQKETADLPLWLKSGQWREIPLYINMDLTNFIMEKELEKKEKKEGHWFSYKMSEIDPKTMDPCEGAFMISENGTRKGVYLFSKDNIVFGRKKDESDIICRVFPYTEVNNNKSKKISRKHLEMIMNGEFYNIKDSSTFGTFVDGRRIPKEELFPLESGALINIAEVLKMKYTEFRDLSSAFSAAPNGKDESYLDYRNSRNVAKEQFKDQLRLKCAVLKFINTLEDKLKFLILVRGATIGFGEACAVVLKDEKISEMHAKIIRNKNTYSLMDLKSNSGTLLNRRRLNPFEPAELREDDEIIMGDTVINFTYKKNLLEGYMFS